MLTASNTQTEIHPAELDAPGGSTTLGEKEYLSLNSSINFYGADGKLQLEKDKEAVRSYFLDHVNLNTVFFHTLKEKLDYLITHDYYEKEWLDRYDYSFVKSMYQKAYAYKHRFPTFVGAYKFYSMYALKTFDGKRYLERYEDRMVANALVQAAGDTELAESLLHELMTGRYQPATPTFLNVGKKQRGAYTSCFLINISDDLNSIGRAVNSALQLSKNGGGVALNLTDIRATGDPIKKIENQSSGVLPIMKLLEDSFSYANQLGQRPGSGAVYLSVHHPDIITFLDTKKEGADEKTRIKTLSLAVSIPDIFLQLAKKGDHYYTFSPYDVARYYGKPFSEVDITAEYQNMVNNPQIRKPSKHNASHLLQLIAESQFQSGYPYLLFVDNANKGNPTSGIIKMSNLCTEILQPQVDSVINDDQSFAKIGEDISCNLGSLNIAKVMQTPDFGKTIDTSMRALTWVTSELSMSAVPSIQNGNNLSHSVGLGAMNLHGYLMEQGITYGSPEALDFANVFFALVNYYSLKSSMAVAMEKNQKFGNFEASTYASGEYFDAYSDDNWLPVTDKVKNLFSDIELPSQNAWEQLRIDVMKNGLYHSHRMAIAPTGSISYCASATASIHPVVQALETRREGLMGRVFYPSYGLTNDNLGEYLDAFAIGNKKLIDTVAAIQKHVDQGVSTTLYFKEDATSRDLNRAQIYAHSKGLKTIYYTRIRKLALEGTDVEGCVSCAV